MGSVRLESMALDCSCDKKVSSEEAQDQIKIMNFYAIQHSRGCTSIARCLRECSNKL